MTRVEFRWPDDLVARIDQARGDVSRAMFVRRAIERALGPEHLSAERAAELLKAGDDFLEKTVEPPEQLEQAPVNPPLVPQGPASVQESRAQMFRRATQR